MFNSWMTTIKNFILIFLLFAIITGNYNIYEWDNIKIFTAAILFIIIDFGIYVENQGRKQNGIK